MKLQKRIHKFVHLVICTIKDPINGLLDYIIRQDELKTQGGPFNRQQERAKIFLEIADIMTPTAIVETGTFRGKTTEYMRRSTSVPVHTVEIELRFYVYNLLRFWRETLVRVNRGDSRQFLRRLADRKEILGSSAFFYLDAHWLKDLPLRDEIELILSHWPNSVMMIDDFQVLDDEGYGFDDYGDGKALSLQYIEGIPNLAKFFPAVASSAETGAKRGCIVIARSPDTVNKLRHVVSLREFA